MNNHAILNKGDIDLVRAWIEDLQRVGYMLSARQANCKTLMGSNAS